MNFLSGNKLAGGNPARGRVTNDYYATNPDSVKALLEVEEIIYPALEPACGEGHISKMLEEDVWSTDLINRGYGDIQGIDFLRKENFTYSKEYQTVITNPPFALFQDFLEKALKVAQKKVTTTTKWK